VKSLSFVYMKRDTGELLLGVICFRRYRFYHCDIVGFVDGKVLGSSL
jgi:hypothetical protein